MTIELPEIAGYLTGVSSALADLDAEERDDLLADVHAHLVDVARGAARWSRVSAPLMPTPPSCALPRACPLPRRPRARRSVPGSSAPSRGSLRTISPCGRSRRLGRSPRSGGSRAATSPPSCSRAWRTAMAGRRRTPGCRTCTAAARTRSPGRPSASPRSSRPPWCRRSGCARMPSGRHPVRQLRIPLRRANLAGSAPPAHPRAATR